MPRLHTKVTAIIADDTKLCRRLFSVEDLEEDSDESVLGGEGKTLQIAISGTLVPNFAPLTTLKKLVLLVDGDVTVKLNGDSTGFRVTSEGTDTDETFRWGKLLLTVTNITAITIINNSSSAIAEVMIGFAG